MRKWGLVVNWQATPVNAISWPECDTSTQLLSLVFRIELVVICWISTATSGNISAGCHLFRLVLKLLSGGNLGYLELT